MAARATHPASWAHHGRGGPPLCMLTLSAGARACVRARDLQVCARPAVSNGGHSQRQLSQHGSQQRPEHCSREGEVLEAAPGTGRAPGRCGQRCTAPGVRSSSASGGPRSGCGWLPACTPLQHCMAAVRCKAALAPLPHSDLLSAMDEAWLGPWRCMLAQPPPPAQLGALQEAAAGLLSEHFEFLFGKDRVAHAACWWACAASAST
jgi:hypothetical protein